MSPILENFANPLNFFLGSSKLYTLIFFISISGLLAILTNFILYKLASKYFSSNSVISIFLNWMRNPLYPILFLFYVTIATYILDFSVISEIINHITKLLLILSVSWSIIKLIDYLELWIAKKYPPPNQNLPPTQSITKFRLLKNITKILVAIIAFALLLLNFDSVEEIGKGVLLSAGVISAIVAFGAQKLMSNIILGFQLAFTKSIQIGDNLSVDGEIGNVEDISLTNITICLWDLRRLILPLSYLLEKPFINYTQPNPDMIGAIVFNVGYSINIDVLRKSLSNAVETNTLWDKRMIKIEVLALLESTLQLRALISARNNGDLWNLSCFLREEVVNFLKNKAPESLPSLHAKIDIFSEKNDFFRS